MYIVENQAFSFSGALHLVEIRDENRLFFIFKHCYRSFSEMYTVAMHEPKHLECFENEMAVVPNIHLIGIEIFKMWVVKYEKKKKICVARFSFQLVLGSRNCTPFQIPNK